MRVSLNIIGLVNASRYYLVVIPSVISGIVIPGIAPSIVIPGTVIPAKAGIHFEPIAKVTMDPGFRRDDSAGDDNAGDNARNDNYSTDFLR